MTYSRTSPSFSSPTMVSPAIGDLVEPLHAVHDHDVPAAQPLQHARLDADQVRVEHAHELVPAPPPDWSAGPGC